jgi:hypothetical protein
MSTPRNHHFVPKFYLKGFTKEASVDGKLWVMNLDNRRSWQTTPTQAAREGDFYRADIGSDVDPMWFERALGESVEPLLAEVLEFVLETKEIPRAPYAFDGFLNLLATSLVRGRAMRMFNSVSFDEGIRRHLGELATSDDIAFRATLDESGLSPEEFTSLNEQGAFQYDFDRITHLKAMMAQVGIALDAFSRRQWAAKVVAAGEPDLVCSDAPVGMIPLAKEAPLLWFDPSVLVVMPLNRRTAAIGSLGDMEQPEMLHTSQVARINAATIRGATEVYCSEPLLSPS